MAKDFQQIVWDESLEMDCRHLVELAIREGDHAEAMMYCFSYAFLLRMRSEALPLEVGSDGVEDLECPLRSGRHSSLVVRGNEIVLKLASRKNKRHGSVLKRSCWCRSCRATCPVHQLGQWLAKLASGSRPFYHISGEEALRKLRARLHSLGVSDAASYILHDFRRGHAQDLVSSGANLRQILAAGEWKSPAFLAYLDWTKLEAGAVMEAHLEESDEE